MRAARVITLRSRGVRPGRLHRSPRTTSLAYFASAGATERTSSDFDIGFAPWTVVCSAADRLPVIRENESTDATSSLIGDFLAWLRGASSATMRPVRLRARLRRWQERRRSGLRPRRAVQARGWQLPGPGRERPCTLP